MSAPASENASTARFDRPGASPASPYRELLAPISGLIELGSGQLTLATVQYDLPGQRARIIAHLRAANPAKALVQVSLQDRSLDLRSQPKVFFESLNEIARSKARGGHDAILLVDWEKRLAPEKKANEQATTSLLKTFNMGRELLVDSLPWPLLVFLPNWAMSLVQEGAPDFVSWRSDAFVFAADFGATRGSLAAALEAAGDGQREGGDRRWERLEWALADAQAVGEEGGFDKLVPQALARLAELKLELGSPGGALRHFEELDNWTGPQATIWRKRTRRSRRLAARALKRDAASPAAEVRLQVLRGAAPLNDTDPLFGREEDLERILEMVLAAPFRCGTVWGETGCGKTSLVRAGLIRELREAGHRPVYINSYDHPVENLRKVIGRQAAIEIGDLTLSELISTAAPGDGHSVILICDQFEQIYRHRRERETGEVPGTVAESLRQLGELIQESSLPVRFLFVIRADHLWRLMSDFNRLRTVLGAIHHPLDEKQNHELGWLRSSDAERVLARIGEDARTSWPDELVEAVVADLSWDGLARPVDTQLIGAALCLRGIRSVPGYRAAGGSDALLKDYLNAIAELTPDHLLTRRVLRQLVIASEPPMRGPPQTAADLAAATSTGMRAVEDALRVLAEVRVVTISDEAENEPSYELIHDALVEASLRAATPQEIGLQTLRRALREGRRILDGRDLWRVLRSDFDQLKDNRRQAAEHLLLASFAALVAKGLTGLLVLAGLAMIASQLVYRHYYLDDSRPSRPLLVRTGTPSLADLPGPFGTRVVSDTGITFETARSTRQRAVESLRLKIWDDPSERLDSLLPLLDNREEGGWHCCVGDWEEGLSLMGHVRYSQSDIYDILAYRGIDPERMELGLAASLDTQHPRDQSAFGVVLGLITSSQERALDAARAILESFTREFSRPRRERGALRMLLRTAAGGEMFLAMLSEGSPELQHAAIAVTPDLELPTDQEARITSRLIDILQSDVDSDVRRLVVIAIRSMSIPDDLTPRLTEVLLEALESYDPALRRAAAATLRTVRVPEAQAGLAVDALLRTLKRQDTQLRLEALRAFRTVSVPTDRLSAVYKALFWFYDNSYSGVWHTAFHADLIISLPQAEALQLRTLLSDLEGQNNDYLGPFFEALHLQYFQGPFKPTLLDSEHFRATLETIKYIIDLNQGEEAELPATASSIIAEDDVLLLISKVEHDAWPVRFAAVAALQSAAIPEPRLQDVTQTLIGHLQDPEIAVAVAAAFQRIPVPPEHAATSLPRLVAMLNADVDTEAAAAQIIKSLPPIIGHENELLTALLKAVREEDDWETAQAVPYHNLGPLLPELLLKLRADDATTRAAVARIFYLLAPPDSQVHEVVAALIERLSDDDRSVREVASEALARQAVPERQIRIAVEALIEATRDEDSAVRATAILGLEDLDIPPELNSLVAEALVDRITEDRGDPWSKAVDSVEWLTLSDRQATEVALVLIQESKGDDGRDRSSARKWLKRLKAPAAPSDILLQALELAAISGDRELDENVTFYFGKCLYFAAVHRPDASVASQLLTLLESKSSRLHASYRRAVVHALAHWYDIGRPGDDTGRILDAEHLALAREEHAALRRQLQEIRNSAPIWLRFAACDVMKEAESTWLEYDPVLQEKLKLIASVRLREYTGM